MGGHKTIFHAQQRIALTGWFGGKDVQPRAGDLPFFDVTFNPTPCTTNPLGVKGAAEAAVVGAPAAIANAVVDALWPFGVRHFDGAATPERIWRAMRQ